MSEEDEKELTEEEYQNRRMQYSMSDQKSWEEEGKSEEEIRKFVEYEQTLTYEERNTAREDRLNARDERERLVHLKQMMKPDEDKSEKEILIEMKNIVKEQNSNWTHQLLAANNEISSDIDTKLMWIAVLLGWILVAIIYID